MPSLGAYTIEQLVAASQNLGNADISVRHPAKTVQISIFHISQSILVIVTQPGEQRQRNKQLLLNVSLARIHERDH